ncbi:MAG TPA: hypothetical protein VFE37_13825 [Chloroflexota bacterium]|nr:hypothetical protein [Chloroflexota bacterium]
MQTLTNVAEMNAKSERWNTRLVGHHDLNGQGDGMQLLKVGQYAYVAHLGVHDMALSILDCADPSAPKLVRQIPHFENTHSHKVQIAGNLLIQNLEKPYFAQKGPQAAKHQAGIITYDLTDPTDPRPIGRLEVEGAGVHRMWMTDGKYAHVASSWPGYHERVYLIADVSDPAHPQKAGIWHIPGTKDGEQPEWLSFPGQHAYVHGIIPEGNRAYVSIVDGGMAIVDISDVANPKTISHINWHPPFGGYNHTSMPLPSRGLVLCVCESVKETVAEDGDKRIWVVDVREERQPVIRSSFPRPTPPAGSPWKDYDERPRRFGPHNVHENRPHYGYRSEHLIFSTWYNAGLRITDLSNPDRPEEVGYFVPPAPEGQGAPQINDVFVDEQRLIYLTDRYNGGMYIVEYEGPDITP